MKKLTLTIALGLLALAAPTTAAAAPIFNLDLHHNQTHFTPGGNQADAFPASSTQTQGSAGENERQTFSLTATGGSFTLGFDPDGAGPQPAETTADLAVGASAAAVRAALEGLPSIGAGDVNVSLSVTGGGSESYSVTFTGALSQTDVAQLLIADGSVPLAIDPEYWIDVSNVGPDATSGTITVRLALPSGITRRYVVTESGESPPFLTWSCPGSPGDSVIVCTTSDAFPRHSFNRQLKVAVAVARTVPEGAVRTASAKASGGGAAEATATEPTPIGSTPAPFGIVAPSFLPDFFEADGLTKEREAGAHPDLLIVPFDFNSVDIPTHSLGIDQKHESDSIRNIEVDTPPGFVGDPTALGECPQAGLVIGACPLSSQVGRIEATTDPPVSNSGDYRTFNRPVYNLTQPRGALSDLAMVIAGNPVHIRASLDPANGYAITTHVPDINETLPPLDQKLVLWGVPADPSHDSERCPPSGGIEGIDSSRECSTDLEPRPFLTMPFECGVEKAWRLHHYDSWQDTGDFGPDLTYTMPGAFTDCDRVPFAPTISLAPTTDAADSPSGLNVRIELPQNEDCEQIVPAPPAGEPQYDCGIATSPLKDATVTLPEGLTVNPASANGLDACTPAQISLGTDEEVEMPRCLQGRLGDSRHGSPRPGRGCRLPRLPKRQPLQQPASRLHRPLRPRPRPAGQDPRPHRRRCGHRADHRHLHRQPAAALLQIRAALQGRRPLLADHAKDLRGLHHLGRVRPLVGHRGGAAQRQLHDRSGRRGRRLRRHRGRAAQLAGLRRRGRQPGLRQLHPLCRAPAPRGRQPAVQRPERLPAAGADRQACGQRAVLGGGAGRGGVKERQSRAGLALLPA